MAKFKVTLTVTIPDEDYDADTLTKEYVNENIVDILADSDNDFSDIEVEVTEPQKSEEE